MSNTISVDRAYEIIKSKFGERLKEERVTDEVLRKDLRKLAGTDFSEYSEFRSFVYGTTEQLKQQCIDRKLARIDSFTSCMRRLDYDEPYEKCLLIRDDYQQIFDGCMKDADGYFEEMISAKKEELGSVDRETIGLYDVSRGAYYSYIAYGLMSSICDELESVLKGDKK